MSQLATTEIDCQTDWLPAQRIVEHETVRLQVRPVNKRSNAAAIAAGCLGICKKAVSQVLTSCGGSVTDWDVQWHVRVKC